MRNLDHVKHVIIKIGSTSLCNEDGQLDKERILKLIQQIAVLKRKGLKVTLVSSGAISSGMGVLNLSKKPKEISKKQALAAIGQAHLMQIYEDLFSLFHLKCAQILLNHDDFDHRKRLMNLSYALSSILDYDVIPIINENDTLAVDEIKVGDNDTLSALLLPIVDAQLLVLVSDIDGLYDDNPHTNPKAKLLSDIELVDDEIMNYAKDSSSQFGTGGMVTKLRAAKIVNDYGGDMAIVNGNNETALIDLLEGKQIGTYFSGKAGRTFVTVENTEINGVFGEMTFVGGVATFVLKHGESKTATGLPSGITYSVTEAEANRDGYTTVASKASGSIIKNDTVTVAFTNTKNSNISEGSDHPNVPSKPSTPTNSPETGDTLNLRLWTSVMGVSLAGLIISLVVVKKNSYRGKRMK